MKIRILNRPPGAAGALVILPADATYDLGRNDNSILVADHLEQSAVVNILGGGLCKCGQSDGTVNCPCASVDEHLAHALAWLAAHDGQTFDDPGYGTPTTGPTPSARGP